MRQPASMYNVMKTQEWKRIRTILFGGLLDEEGRMKGSALVMEFPDKVALEEYLKNKPYVVVGVWQKIEVETMNVVLVNGEKRV